MRFNVENLGPLKNADIAISNLTILCGKNNCGKTYLTYSLYAFLATIQQNFVLPIEQFFDTCYKEGRCSIDIEKIWSSFNDLLLNRLKPFAIYLPNLLTKSPLSLNKDFKISVIMEDCDYENFKKIKNIAKFQVTEKCAIHIEKQEQSSKLDVRIENTGDRLPRKENLRKIFSVVCSIFVNRMIFPDAFSLTGERSGISIFADNIADFSRKMENISMPAATRKKCTKIVEEAEVPDHLFPLPVEQEFSFFQNLRRIRKRVSYICKEHPELLATADQLSGGRYHFDDQLGIQYFPDGTETPLTLSESSSSVKSLVEFDFYLRHCAKKNQILMIDEPELNLHPENQRKLARLLAMLVNIGVKVFITTHSDYIIKELNTLIMLKQDKPHITKIRKKENYSDSELLDVSNVKAYVAQYTEDGIIFDEAFVSQMDGITISTLDEVIDKMNQIQDEIIWGSEEDA